MDIAVLGATGRVGTHLVNLIAQSETDRLVTCYVSPNSEWLGKTVGDSDSVYQSTGKLPDTPCDLLIDFSTPAAVMAVIDDIERRACACVIGTTGFSDEEIERIAFASESLPILLSANFAESFEPFISACRTLAATYPDRVPELEETYHTRKKAVPSGTSLRTQREVIEARLKAGADPNEEVPIKIHRVGNTVGKHVFRLDLEATVFEIGFEVESLESYARGALRAGRWVAGQPKGLYSTADYLASKQ